MALRDKLREQAQQAQQPGYLPPPPHSPHVPRPKTYGASPGQRLAQLPPIAPPPGRGVYLGLFDAPIWKDPLALLGVAVIALALTGLLARSEDADDGTAAALLGGAMMVSLLWILPVYARQVRRSGNSWTRTVGSVTLAAVGLLLAGAAVAGVAGLATGSSQQNDAASESGPAEAAPTSAPMVPATSVPAETVPPSPTSSVAAPTLGGPLAAFDEALGPRAFPGLDGEFLSSHTYLPCDGQEQPQLAVSFELGLATSVNYGPCDARILSGVREAEGEAARFFPPDAVRVREFVSSLDEPAVEYRSALLARAYSDPERLFRDCDGEPVDAGTFTIVVMENERFMATGTCP